VLVVAFRDDELCLWEVRKGGKPSPAPETGALPRIYLCKSVLICGRMALLLCLATMDFGQNEQNFQNPHLFDFVNSV
jgi:hypothetical protein